LSQRENQHAIQGLFALIFYGGIVTGPDEKRYILRAYFLHYCANNDMFFDKKVNKLLCFCEKLQKNERF
jgi:hypothetical protein